MSQKLLEIHTMDKNDQLERSFLVVSYVLVDNVHSTPVVSLYQERSNEWQNQFDKLFGEKKESE